MIGNWAVSRLLILDGHAYAYRAFHAIRDLRGPEGRPTNAIYGFIKMLEKMRAALEPAYLVVVWDGGLSAERVAAHPEYKASVRKCRRSCGRSWMRSWVIWPRRESPVIVATGWRPMITLAAWRGGRRRRAGTW